MKDEKKGAQIPAKDQEMERRDVYYIFRAMHDNTCPNCGHSKGDDLRPEGFKIPSTGALICPSCQFTITFNQQIIIKSFTHDVLKRRLQSFEIFAMRYNI